MPSPSPPPRRCSTILPRAARAFQRAAKSSRGLADGNRAGGVAPGIALVVDPLGAGAAALVAALGSRRWFFRGGTSSRSGTLFHTLMLVFLAGMIGFCLSGDLFTMFVFFELMGVAAYALTSYKMAEAESLDGALNFAIINSLGGLLILWGIALLYGQFGALNLAQISRALTSGAPDGLVIVSFTLIICRILCQSRRRAVSFLARRCPGRRAAPVCALLAA